MFVTTIAVLGTFYMLTYGYVYVLDRAFPTPPSPQSVPLKPLPSSDRPASPLHETSSDSESPPVTTLGHML